MTLATCHLCQQQRYLQNSHLLAAGFYKIARKHSPPGKHPVAISDGGAVSTSRQICEPMLCKECEQRFNQEGEDWVLQHCWRGPQEFPLGQLLRGETPATTVEDLRLYGPATIDLTKLVYFGASVFWRAAAKSWKDPRGKTIRQLKFGPYEEQLRKFLLGAEWPQGFVLIVTLNKDLATQNDQFPAIAGGVICPPHSRRRGDTYHQYEFLIPGMFFRGLLGSVIPLAVGEISTCPGGFLHVCSEDEWLKTFRRMVKESVPKGAIGKAIRGTGT